MPESPPPVQPRGAAGPFRRSRPERVPAPPGGHALRIDPSLRQTAPPPAPRPVVDEVSAGGLVIRWQADHPQAAIIARRNRGGRLEWCLPKGHLEGRETPEQAAVREIAEETGIVGRIESLLGVIDYWFSGEDRRVHKVVHHFLLHAIGGALTVDNDPDGEAEEAEWVDLNALNDRLAYPNERRLAQLAHDKLRGGYAHVYEHMTFRGPEPGPDRSDPA